MKGWKISLVDMEFLAKIGWYDFERSLGNHFSVDIELCVEKLDIDINEQLDKTLNYEEVYRIVGQRMGEEAKLMETVCLKIADDIRKQWPSITSGKICLKKKLPPMKGKIRYSQVEYYF